MTIYLVEDEPSLCDILQKHLEGAGYEVTSFNRGDDALRRIEEQPPDLAVLDIMLPGLDGLSVLREIRTRQNFPVLFISARKSELDRILGIELGADDYLVKPFSSRELVARVRALFRRVDRERASEALEPAGRAVQTRRLALDLDRRRLYCGAQGVELTGLEFQLMSRLMANVSVVIPRGNLLEEASSDSRAVDVHIKNLRRKVEGLGLPGTIIETVRGIGYRFED